MTGDQDTHYDAYQHRADRLTIDRLEAENKELRQVVAQQSARLEKQARALAAVREVCGVFAADIDVPVNVVLRALDGGSDE